MSGEAPWTDIGYAVHPRAIFVHFCHRFPQLPADLRNNRDENLAQMPKKIYLSY